MKILLPKQEIAAFCKNNYICKLSVFGSILRNDYGPNSDIDILVEFEEGKTPGFLRLSHMEGELSRILGNKRVDLRTPAELSKYFREEVLSSAEVQYAQG